MACVERRARRPQHGGRRETGKGPPPREGSWGELQVCAVEPQAAAETTKGRVMCNVRKGARPKVSVPYSRRRLSSRGSEGACGAGRKNSASRGRESRLGEDSNPWPSAHWRAGLTRCAEETPRLARGCGSGATAGRSRSSLPTAPVDPEPRKPGKWSPRCVLVASETRALGDSEYNGQTDGPPAPLALLHCHLVGQRRRHARGRDDRGLEPTGSAEAEQPTGSRDYFAPAAPLAPLPPLRSGGRRRSRREGVGIGTSKPEGAEMSRGVLHEDADRTGRPWEDLGR